MKSQIVADSSALFSLLIENDTNHHLATKVGGRLVFHTGILIIPAEIFAETINILGKKTGKKNAIVVGQKLMENNLFTIIESTNEIRSKAFEKFKRQPESVSFTDCLVMAFADEFKTEFIFGFDETFKKNGYIRVGIDDTA
ncbi:MAG: PIN domain-containing protein [Patescibacteria group bacterium]